MTRNDSAARIQELREAANRDVLDLMYPEEAHALLDIYEAASDFLIHGFDHPSGQVKMMNGSTQPCSLCVALDRFRAASLAQGAEGVRDAAAANESRPHPADVIEELVTACEEAFIPATVDPEIGPFPDEDDVTGPPSGITFGMIRRAREALNAI